MTGARLHRGKLAKPPRILSVRPLEREDLAVLHEKRPAQGRVRTLRAQHHRLAYMLASGMTIREVSDVTGYSTSRLLQLKDDPSFRQLMAESKPDAQAAARLAVDEFSRLKMENAMLAMEIENEHLNRCVDRMDQDPESELVPLKYLLPITSDFADRFGYGKHTTQTNKVLDFAKMMEQAQVFKGSGPVIDATPRSSAVASEPARVSTAPDPSSQATLAVGNGIRRRL